MMPKTDEGSARADNPISSTKADPHAATLLQSTLRAWEALRSHAAIGRFDFGFLILLIFATFVYHHDSLYWSGQVTVGKWQFGDAEFWWSGAIQFAAGLFRENVNLTYRMGYAVFAGLWVALFGSDFSLFHTFLLTLFVMAWYALYLALRPTLGKLLAAAAILLVAINPFTAEWLAVSSSDSLGLLLNTWMLALLLFGLKGNLSAIRLAGGGLFLALSSLTRPLMTPFIVPAILLPLLAVSVDWHRRLRCALALLAAFLIPTLFWVGMLRSISGSWKLAGSDVATFYAASDPQIQVWNPNMFAKVESSAKVRFGVPSVTASQLDSEFWHLTLRNYSQYAGYHLRRVIPEVIAMAGMSIDQATHVDTRSRMLRGLVLAVVVGSLVVTLLRRRAFVRGYLVLCLGLASMFVDHIALIVLPAILCVVLLALWDRSASSIALIAAYWCIGGISLYLVGGFFGPPLSPGTAINALGYRLGSQFFFSADIILLYLFHGICTFQLPKSAPSTEPLPFIWPQSWDVSRVWASSVIAAAFVVGLGLLGCEMAAGAVTVAAHMIRRTVTSSQPFPDITPVYQICAQQIHKLLPSARIQISVDGTASGLQGNDDTPYVLSTGASLDPVWNFSGQDRAALLLSWQTRIVPFDFAARMLADVPHHLNESEWGRLQGAWLLRRVKDEPPLSNLPWHYSNAAVRAVIPLKDDRSAFDIAKARWFPVAKYGSQLRIANELSVENGTMEASPAPGLELRPRRFGLRSTAAPDIPVAITISAQKAVGARNLRFGWQYELAQGELPRTLNLRVTRYGLREAGNVKPLETTEEMIAVSTITPMKRMDLDLNKPWTERIRLEFSGLRPGDVAWIYELNLVADDWGW